MWSRQGVSQSPALLRATVTICVTAGIDGGSRNAPRGSNSSQSCDALRRLESCSHKATRCERQHRSNAARCDVPLDYLDKRNRLCSTATPRALHCKQAPNHQRVVLSGANDKESLFSTEKIGKAAFIMVPFAWGVVDWLHPPWYDVVLEAFRG